MCCILQRGQQSLRHQHETVCLRVRQQHLQCENSFFFTIFFFGGGGTDTSVFGDTFCGTFCGAIDTFAVADPGFSPGGGANSQKCYYFSIFCQKLHENERIWTPRGGRASLAPPLDPPMLCFGDTFCGQFFWGH